MNMLRVLVQEAILKHNYDLDTTYKLLANRYTRDQVYEMWYLVNKEVDNE